ncbi:MAG: hypothetical protein KBT87_11845 [Gammaproteobacteria bacterium]|jgi:hypothetical protein|nr:hypothetical protein [Gammaproteobacteria bacterium]MBQ0775357.1 hypothetical protein [Gammaproteobacteria bacterium]
MSNATGPQSLSRLLADTPAIQRLICDARSRAKQESAPPALDLPPALAAHTEIQVLPDKLILLASNNSVAQLLRFHGPRLARQAGLVDFQVRVQAQIFSANPNKQPEPQGASMPAEAAAPLNDAASAVDHAPLSDALRRLAALAGR